MMKKFIYSTVAAIMMIGFMTGCGKDNGNDSSATDTTTVITTEDSTVNSTEEATTGEDVTTEEATTGDDTTTEDTVSEGPSVSDKPAAEIAEAILNGGEYKETLQPLSEQVALNRLYALDAEQIEESAFYTNSQATAEEIAVIKVKSEDYVSAVKESFNLRVEDQKAACADYLPDEMPKLENAVIYDNGCYVILSISVDSEKVEEVISGLFQ